MFDSFLVNASVVAEVVGKILFSFVFFLTI
jgi:hypothetical protein